MRHQTLLHLDTSANLEQLKVAASEMIKEVEASVGLVYLPSPDGGRVLQLAALYGAPQQMLVPWERVALDAPLPLPEAIRQGQMVWLSGPEDLASRYPRLGLAFPYDYMLAASPITDGATVVGGLLLLWPGSQPRELNRHKRDTIEAFCRHVGLLARQSGRRGRPLLCPTRPHVLLGPHGSAPAEGDVAIEFAERLPVGCCSVDLDGRLLFVNSAAVDLLGAGVGDLQGARPWEVLPWLQATGDFEDRYRAAVFSRKPSVFTALRPPDSWLIFHLYPDPSGISIHITPAPPGRTPTKHEPAEADMLPTPEMAGVGAIYQMMHLTAAFTEAAGLRDVVDLVAGQIVPAFGPQALALITAQEGKLHVVGHRGMADLVNRVEGMPLVSGTQAARTLATGEPAFFATFNDLQRANPGALAQEGLDARAFLPLIASGHTIGSIVLGYDRPRDFSLEERAIWMSLAGLIGQALDRGRLYDTKNQLAHALQSELLPQALPQVPGLNLAARYLPAGYGMDVGGDFYDLIQVDDANVIAAIGDVQGHNITAAALMGQVSTAAHAHATLGMPPGEILACTNRHLISRKTELFASCLIVRLDLTHQRAQLATAGHPPPLIRHPDGRAEALDLPPRLLLGIHPDADYTTTEIPMPPGTVLALYTDGLVEVPGTDIDDTTADLARHLARATGQSMDALADTLQTHAPTSAQRKDDNALLLIETHPQT